MPKRLSSKAVLFSNVTKNWSTGVMREAVRPLSSLPRDAEEVRGERQLRLYSNTHFACAVESPADCV